jgi:hypothetical protein
MAGHSQQQAGGEGVLMAGVLRIKTRHGVEQRCNPIFGVDGIS